MYHYDVTVKARAKKRGMKTFEVRVHARDLEAARGGAVEWCEAHGYTDITTGAIDQVTPVRKHVVRVTPLEHEPSKLPTGKTTRARERVELECGHVVERPVEGRVTASRKKMICDECTFHSARLVKE